MPSKINISKDILFDLYHNQRKTQEEICDITGIKSPITIKKLMIEHNIERRDHNAETSILGLNGLTAAELKWQLHNLYIDQKKSMCEIGKNFSVTHIVISKMLRRYGIETMTPTEANRFHSFGERNRIWKGGERLQHGYKQILIRNHPHSTGNGYVYEHRYVMEQHLKRYLSSEEVVHHINEDKLDNRIENLKIMTRKEHLAHHSKLRAQ